MKLSDRNRWILILLEIGICFFFIYFSNFLNLPNHDYFRYTVLIPLYQAGSAFGYTGGIISGLLVTLLFFPLIPIDPLIKESPYGIPSAIVMILFIIAFGIFVGGIIGKGRKNQQHVNMLSQIFLNIARETSEHNIMLRLAWDTFSFIETQYAAVLFREGSRKLPLPWEMIGISKQGIKSITDFTLNHPLVKAAVEKDFLITNSVSADQRFKHFYKENLLKSVLITPVFFESKVYGSLLLSNKKNEEHFTQKDLSMALLLSNTAGAAIYNIEQEKKRQEQKLREEQMKELFSKFVSSSVAEYVLNNPDVLKGRWQEVTILVSDIRDFTRISENLSPREIVEQINEYFTVMVDIIFESKGTIDKFIGDCIIAYWGAPQPDSNHALDATQAAVKMTDALNELNRKWITSDKPNFSTGIALHTCKVLIGNVGDDRKKAFTIMGEEVEKSISIESLTKIYGVKIIVSNQTAQIISNKFQLKKLLDNEADKFGELYELLL